jgi:hypothetical protein
LARVGALHAERAGEIARAIEPFLKSKSQELAETAICALGILGNERSSLRLGDVLLDTRAGRELVGAATGVSTRSRAFAAFGMGILGDRTENEDVRRHLLQRFERRLLGFNSDSR